MAPSQYRISQIQNAVFKLDAARPLVCETQLPFKSNGV
jgi:hypothetical protein